MLSAFQNDKQTQNQVLAAYDARRTKDTTDEVSEQQMIEERFIISYAPFCGMGSL